MYIYDIQSDLWHRNYPKLKLKFGVHCAPVLPKNNIIENQNIRFGVQICTNLFHLNNSDIRSVYLNTKNLNDQLFYGHVMC